jgi:hypothetical protein
MGLDPVQSAPISHWTLDNVLEEALLNGFLKITASVLLQGWQFC